MNKKEETQEKVWNYLDVNSESGNIVKAAHDGDKTARVQFKNGLYESSEITLDDWNDFAATFASTKESTGSYYNKNLRKFKWKKIS